MPSKASSKGFSAIEAVFIVLVIAVLGLGGWYVWHKNKKDDTAKPSTNSQTNNKPSDTPPADPSEGGKYLVVKEWGVRFQLPEALQGDVLTSVSNVDSSGTVLFASKKLNNLTGDNTCNFVKQPDGSYSGGIQASLSRINPKTYPAESLDYFKSQLTYVTKLGDFEYYARKPAKNPPITCLTGQHEEFNSTEQAITDQLNTAFTKLEAVKN